MLIKLNNANNKKGAALIFVMVAMLIVSIMIAIAASASQANLKQASDQEKGIEAYYIARSGAELAYDALLTKTPSLLDAFAANPALVLDNGGQAIDFESGTALVTVTSSGTGDTQKILITSVGTLTSTGKSRMVKLEFFRAYDVNPEMIWSD